MIGLNKNKTIMAITIGLMSMILVYVMFLQFRTINQNDVDEIEIMRETELRELLANYKTTYDEAKEELTEVQGKINEYKQGEKQEESTIALLEGEIKDANMKLGFTDVKGEGVIIKMQISKNTSLLDLKDGLLYLMNELFLAGAEAISINDQRIVAMSDIVNPRRFYFN